MSDYILEYFFNNLKYQKKESPIYNFKNNNFDIFHLYIIIILIFYHILSFSKFIEKKLFLKILNLMIVYLSLED